ncbi:MAG: restriction endonuclease [Clostridiales bacterium]|nr:restriction endonuclease [Clostridiales bacterium]MDD6935862.1 restriction endonuclease [Clostridiales bacterium]MDY2961619.1 restriction endonuclease [Oscillospiraceae bacterium]
MCLIEIILFLFAIYILVAIYRGISRGVSNIVESRDKTTKDLKRRLADVQQKEQSLSALGDSYSAKLQRLEAEQASYDDLVRLGVLDKISNGAAKGFFSNSDVFRAMRSSDIFDNERFYSAFTSPMRFEGVPAASCRIHGSEDNVYTVTLNSCTCEDFLYRHTPCKHMFRLGIELGLLQALNCDEIEDKISDLQSERVSLKAEQKRVSQDINRLETKKIQIQKKEDHLLEESERQNLFVSRMIEDSFNPDWVADIYADYECASDAALVNYLRTKSPAAPAKASEIERDYKQSKREWVRRAKAAEYQLQLYESQFPELESFKEITPDDIPDESNIFSESDPALSWLSNDEYETLPLVDKFQLALDRYKARNKKKWEIGIDFERYIGYQYYLDGYRIEQHGAIHGLNDLGRDLLVSKGSEVIIIQCKRWSAEKTIHEKHIFQLYGTVVAYQIENPNKKVIGLFICTCSLSDTAKRFADFLGVQYKENASAGDYPLIKCNINRTTKERIYHLPFDQQYDRVVISPNSEECYAWTVQEAEDKGFRRAWRWHSQQGATS